MRVKTEYVLKYVCPKCSAAYVRAIPKFEPTPLVKCLACGFSFGLRVPAGKL